MSENECIENNFQSDKSRDSEKARIANELNLLREEKLRRRVEIYERMIEEKRSDSLIRILPSPLLFLLFSMIAMIAILLITISIGSEVRYQKKSDIQANILAAISNGADLRAVRNIFENRHLSSKTLRQFFSNMDEYYTEDVPLSKTLEDIRSSLFSTNSDKGKLLDTLDKLILEHMERNPFDALEPNQKDLFENIRLKSGENYTQFRGDIDKLATELESKNSLVNTYLNRSNTSFWISIIALVFSMGVGIFQIYQNRSSKFRLLVASALADLNESDSNFNNDDNKNSNMSLKRDRVKR